MFNYNRHIARAYFAHLDRGVRMAMIQGRFRVARRRFSLRDPRRLIRIGEGENILATQLSLSQILALGSGDAARQLEDLEDL